MVDFLAENNLCGQTILNLVSWGNAIIAELLRLSKFIPPVFRPDACLKPEFTKYVGLLFDFRYFKNSEYFEENIISKPGLEELDEEFKDNHLEILTRFYQVFESITKYINDLNRSFVEDLNEGVFIQQSLESALQNEDGKQLMCESIYLYGVMLLIVDQNFEGSVREKMLVSYYRYSASKMSSESNLDDVCKLLRATGFSLAPNSKRPTDYPESFFSRVSLNSTFVSMVLSRLRSDDVYNQISAYPLPDHRSNALATQASMLYIVLFFAPDVLHHQHHIMREVVDKFFPDNWVTSVYMGLMVNLVDAWSPYKAATLALNDTIESNNIKSLTVRHSNKVLAMLSTLDNILQEGVLTKHYILKNVNKLLNDLRDCNVALRWLMLHTAPLAVTHPETTKKCRQLREQLLQDSKCSKHQIFQLLIFTADLELKFKKMLKKMLDDKKLMWDNNKKEAADRLMELSEIFDGAKPLTRVEKNAKLQDWFYKMSNQINQLDYDDSTAAGRRIVQLIQALEEVQEFHQLENIMQVKQFLTDTRSYMHQMIKIINIKEESLINLQIVADVSYAWKIIDRQMQRGIIKDPSLVIKLRATFLKLASALDLPLLRINQSNSLDLVSVSEYYSKELVAYVQQVLQIIPETMFTLLARIINLLTSSIKEVPTRLDKEKMKDYAQLNERYEVAKLTNSISIFAEGMLMMKQTLVGVIKIDPKRLLEDGIRKELVMRVSRALNETLVFKAKASRSNNELFTKLDELGYIVDGYHRSFEYIQDYVDVCGLKIWQEEISRIITFNIEQECNSFLRNKVLGWQSVHQSQNIPIPSFPSIDCSITFIGRLIREILRVTDSRCSVYSNITSTWYDIKTKQEVVNLKLFEKIEKSLGTWGLAGLDRLLSFMIVQTLQTYTSFFSHINFQPKFFRFLLTSLPTVLQSFPCILQSDKQHLHILLSSTIFIPSSAVAPSYFKIGQMQLLKRLINYQLSSSCKFESKFFYSALQNMNDILLSKIELQCTNPNNAAFESSSLLYELSNYMESSGLSNPLDKVYISAENSPRVSLFNFIMISSLLQRLNCNFAKRMSDCIDGIPFVVGIVTIMKQYHLKSSLEFVMILSKHAKTLVQPQKFVSYFLL
ncbi:hypothetical protein HELRODRAFT_81068 [Helobdella robusta]|uniref:WASH complex subunit strumpellin n=1 Tax=Helobdella robusta TaxID=6412 RepID=T1G485_HELRO|nr:hypothetical protein HELRODRAFT_81068 [Helobdella robusta]ESO02903.1 hypothetical protein HELRODRAFT_81068 [Helobdella robusta]